MTRKEIESLGYIDAVAALESCLGHEAWMLSCLPEVLVFRIQGEMACAKIGEDEHTHWMALRSPFEPGGKWWCGFTRYGFTGWNGRDDHGMTGATPWEACVKAALCVFEKPKC